MGSDRWDEPPLDIQIPDDAQELDRDVLAYHRELRALRRRRRLKRLAGPLAGNGAIMPLLASILAVCLVAGAMLSVATFSPAPGVRTTPSAPPTAPALKTPALKTPALGPRPTASRVSPSPSASASVPVRPGGPLTPR